MDITIVASGSKGNCYIFTDVSGRQLIVECGVKSSLIIQNSKMSKVDACFISHAHNDHSLSRDFLAEYVPIFDENNLQDGKTITIGNWKVLPIKAYHTVACFSFMIANTKERKKVLFVTDTRHINPNIADTPLDCALIEANYSLQYVVENFEKVTNFGYKNHLSIESVCEWLDSRQFKPNNLVLIHLSQSGNIEPTRALEAVRERIPTAELASQNLRITV